MRIFRDLHNMLFPASCLLCRRLLVEGERHICLECMCRLPFSDYHKESNSPVERLFAGYDTVDYATAYLRFDKKGTVQSLLHSFKYHGNRSLAEYLGRIAGLELHSAGIFHDIDVIIPVPLHKDKYALRGYNQSECISRGIASVYGCGVDVLSLRRDVNNSSQTNKQIYERHANVDGVFSVDRPDMLHNKRVLLVDDMLTTGATMQSCIASLSAVWGIRVSVFSFASG